MAKDEKVEWQCAKDSVGYMVLNSSGSWQLIWQVHLRINSLYSAYIVI